MPDASSSSSSHSSARQRRYWWVAALVLALGGGGAVAAGVAWTLVNTNSGREWILGQVTARTSGLFEGRGHLKIGAIRELGAREIVVEDVALVDTVGVSVVSARRIAVSLNWSALFTKAIHLGHVKIDDLSLQLQQDWPDRPWNIAYIVAGDTTAHEASVKPGFGDDIQIASLIISNALITTVAPWEPHPAFTGSARDSVIAVRDSLHNLIHVADGRLLEKREIEFGRLRASDIVVANPQGRPSSLLLDSLSGRISDPAVAINQAEGELQWTSDSLSLKISKAVLPASMVSATGSISWALPGPLRYDVNARADAGLSDLQWVWDVLPTNGRGSADVRMRTLENPENVEYALSNLDVETDGSRLRGKVSITLRPTDLLLHNTDLSFSPLQTDLLRRISDGALPTSIEGRITGRFVAESGGALSSLLIDRLQVNFIDDGYKGAGPRPESRIVLAGIVGAGANPFARNLSVSDLRLDLRTIQPFPDSTVSPDGVLTGNFAGLSVDMQHLNLPSVALRWTDSADNVSVVRGTLAAQFAKQPDKTNGASGGFTDLSAISEVNARFVMEPLSFSALARIDSTIPINSSIAGVVNLNGSAADLNWSAELFAVPSKETVVAIDGDSIPVSLRSVSLSGTAGVGDRQWRATANGLLSALDLRQWLGEDRAPQTALNGRFDARIQGTRTVGSADEEQVTAQTEPPTGEISFQVSQDAGRSQPGVQTSGRVTLDESRLRIDSGVVELGGLKLEANGRLARDSMSTDTLEVSLNTDSLDAIREELLRLASAISPLDSVVASSIRRIASDTLQGGLTASGYITGNLKDIAANAALGGRAVQVGGLKADRIFGSLRAEQILSQPVFDGAVTLDDVDGIGALRIHSATARVGPAGADSGQLTLDVGTETDAQLIVRGAYRRDQGSTTVSLDSVRLSYSDVIWSATGPAVITIDSTNLDLKPVRLGSSAGGSLSMSASVPAHGGVNGSLQVNQFPFGELATLLVGTQPIAGTVTGNAQLSGSRESPLIAWRLTGDSLGINGYRLPVLATDGSYSEQLLQGEVVLADSTGGSLRAQATLPVDLRMIEVSNRRGADSVQGTISANSLRLDALPLQLEGVSRVMGELRGEMAFEGTMERMRANGTMTLVRAGLTLDELGIAPNDGLVVLKADGDSVILESLRIRSGRSNGDTLVAHGVLRIPANAQSTLDLKVKANNFEMARKADGTDLIIAGDIGISGNLDRPVVSGRLRVPTANIVVDPLGERVALDLTSESAKALLGLEEVPVAESAAATLSAFGSVVSVENARVDLGQDVWVQTPEARVKLGGGLGIAMSGERLVLDGEITAERGQYRLELGPVYRGFSIDSGSVRFYPSPAIAPSLDINATNTVRVAGGGDVPIKLHIAGGYDKPTLTLSSTDPLYSSAPESEIISLLIFGAPTFALDGQSQSTVRAVTGLLLPTVGGAVEGALQRILPGDFNTVQVSTGSNESLTSLAPTSLLDNLNLSISAGKQIGNRTYLRLNTGVCRGSGQSSMQGAQLWAGIAVEYRIARGWLAQLGVDPGSAPCTRVGGTELPRMQFGFDLFRDWIF